MKRKAPLYKMIRKYEYMYKINVAQCLLVFTAVGKAKPEGPVCLVLNFSSDFRNGWYVHFGYVNERNILGVLVCTNWKTNQVLNHEIQNVWGQT